MRWKQAGADGVKGSRAIAGTTEGQAGQGHRPNARDELLQAGIIDREKNGRGYLYTIAK